jgi:hypothetical protein
MVLGQRAKWQLNLVTSHHEPSELFAMLDDHLPKAMRLGKKAEIARLDEILYNLYSNLSALHQMLFMV